MVGDVELLFRDVVVSWHINFLLDGAFNSHLVLGGLGDEPPVDDSGESITISNFAVVVIVVVLFVVGRKIGTNADLTTSICSSSESWSEDCSFVEFNSMELFILPNCMWDGCDKGGLDDEFLDEAGDNRDVEIRSFDGREGVVVLQPDTIGLMPLAVRRDCKS